MDTATDSRFAAAQAPCYHCGEEVPGGTHYGLEIDGAYRAMCCPGCAAVAGMIRGAGLEHFYRQRTAYNERPEETPGSRAQFSVYDDPAVNESFTDPAANGQVSARLLLGGISCAACTWLIEKALRAVPGVSGARVNLA
ncbi:MAG: copper-translocating P-type ATPase, partial [Halioglobus sp.]|nr:copper-translocating P-type ATPase [Halioglobus sp.]